MRLRSENERSYPHLNPLPWTGEEVLSPLAGRLRSAFGGRELERGYCGFRVKPGMTKRIVCAATTEEVKLYSKK